MHGMGRMGKPAFRSSWDPTEYFLRNMVFVCPGERWMEKRNARGYVNVNKCGSSSGRAATGGKARPGGPLGSGCHQGYSRVARRFGRAARITREKARDRHP